MKPNLLFEVNILRRMSGHPGRLTGFLETIGEETNELLRPESTKACLEKKQSYGHHMLTVVLVILIFNEASS